jgi:hypothetical protein
MSATDERRTSYPALHIFIFLISFSNYIFHLLGYYIEPFALASVVILSAEIPDIKSADGQYLPQVKSTLSALFFVFIQALTSTILILFLLYRHIKSLIFPLHGRNVESIQVFIYLLILYSISAFMLSPYGLSMFSSSTSKLSGGPYWLTLLILTFFWPLILSGSILSLLEPSKISGSVGKHSAISRTINQHRKGR